MSIVQRSGKVAGVGVLIWVASGAVACAQPAGQFPELGASVAVGDGRVEPCSSSLVGEVRCGRFRVWENRDAKNGRTLDLAFVVLKATGERGQPDALTYFFGGPGAAATPAASLLAESPLRAERDILLIDQRGTGQSGALFCDVPYPGGLPSRFRSVFPPDHVEACHAKLSRRADLTQYHTLNAMDDLADLAPWLGYAQLNFSGGSYGSREAQVFTRRHSELVRTVVLNGAVPVEIPAYIRNARALHAALDNMLDECASQADCARAYPNLRDVLVSVLAVAENEPATVVSGGERVRFGKGPLSYAIRGLLYSASGTLPEQLYEAHAGDWQPLADYYIGRQAWVGNAAGVPAGYHYSVICAEEVNRLSWDDIERETRGTYMGDHLIAGYKRACERWSSASLPAEHFTPVRSEVPALILSGGRDPVTPPELAVHVAETWTNSVHVIFPNSGHGQRGPCVNAMVRRLVETGSVVGLDTSCVQRAPPTRFTVAR